MSNLKKITEVPVVENVENINLIANSNGAAVQVAANQIGAQADWNETDESSPAFIMNKPTSLGGGGVEVVTYVISEPSIMDPDYNVITAATLIQKFNAGATIRCLDRFNKNICGTVVGYRPYNDKTMVTAVIDSGVHNYIVD
jgi:hypothetical protein